MKKHIALALCIVFALSLLPGFASAAGTVAVTIDGTPVEFTESSGSPFIDSNDRTLVPLRVTMEQSGCEVYWDNENRCAVVYKSGVTVVVSIGSNCIEVNGIAESIDTAAVIKDDRTYLPIRAVLEAVGCTMEWDAASRTVVVKNGTKPGKYTEQASKIVAALESNPNINDEDKSIYTDWCSRFFSYFELDSGIIDRTVSRLSTLKVIHGTIPSFAPSYVPDAAGLANSSQNTIWINDSLAGKGDKNIGSYYKNVMIHELNHIISGTYDTATFLNEGLVEELTVESTGNYYYNNYQSLRQSVLVITALVGVDTVLDAFFANDASIIYSALSAYDDMTADQTETYLEGLLKKMLDARNVNSTADYLSAFDEFNEYITGVYKAEYGKNYQSDVLFFTLMSELRANCGNGSLGLIFIKTQPAPFVGDNCRYYFRLKDINNQYSSDGEIIIYPYDAAA